MATAPGTEGPLEVEAGDTLIGADEGILDHILDQRLVMGNQIGSPERPERVDPHQDVHPVDLASLEPDDALDFLHAHLLAPYSAVSAVGLCVTLTTGQHPVRFIFRRVRPGTGGQEGLAPIRDGTS